MDHFSARPRRVLCGVRVAALAGVTALLVTSCTGAPTGDDDAGEPPSAPATTASSAPTVAPLPEARDGWKVFTDPGRLLTFELPEPWVVQAIEVEPETYAPDSLHYAIRTPEGTTAAELHTGIGAAQVPCEETDRTPYYVIGSEPLEEAGLTAADDRLEPRFVTRLITGFRFFGSYGITDQAGGDDGLACELSNTVQGGDALGRVSFGDLEVLAPKAPADTGPQTVSFGTIGEAEEYYATAEFEVIGELIRSLRFAGEQPIPG